MSYGLKFVFYTYCSTGGVEMPDVFVAANREQTYDDLVKIVKDCYKDSQTPLLRIYPETKTIDEKNLLQASFQKMLGETHPKETTKVSNLMRCINQLSWSI